MHRHAFNPASFFFGALFLTVGLVLLNRASVGLSMDWVLPVVLLALGALIAFTALTRDRGDDPATPNGEAPA